MQIRLKYAQKLCKTTFPKSLGLTKHTIIIYMIEPVVITLPCPYHISIFIHCPDVHPVRIYDTYRISEAVGIRTDAVVLLGQRVGGCTFTFTKIGIFFFAKNCTSKVTYYSRVDLEGYCDCAWRGFETVSGWFKRGEALREQLASDKLRHAKYKLLHPGTCPSTVNVLLNGL